MTDQQESNYAAAERSADASPDTPSVFATLAVVDAIRELTGAVREQTRELKALTTLTRQQARKR